MLHLNISCQGSAWFWFLLWFFNSCFCPPGGVGLCWWRGAPVADHQSEADKRHQAPALCKTAFLDWFLDSCSCKFLFLAPGLPCSLGGSLGLVSGPLALEILCKVWTVAFLDVLWFFLHVGVLSVLPFCTPIKGFCVWSTGLVSAFRS